MIAIGTVHDDIEGRQRLLKFLEHLKPRTIGLEIPEGYGIEGVIAIIEENQTKLLKIAETIMPDEEVNKKRLIKEIIKVDGYEVFAVREYVERTGALIVPVDDPIVLTGPKKDPTEHVFFMYARMHMPIGEVEKNCGRFEALEYDVARALFVREFDKIMYESGLFHVATPLDSEAERERREAREQGMVNRLKAAHPDVTVGGLGHFVAIPDMIFQNAGARLGGLVEKVYKLHEAEKLEAVAAK